MRFLVFLWTQLLLVLADTSQFHSAIERLDQEISTKPNDFLPLFKRATTYLQYGKNTQAIADLSLVLQLKPDFEQALVQRAKLYIQDGQFDQGTSDLEKLLAVKQDAEVSALVASANDAKSQLKEAIKWMDSKNYQQALSHWSIVINVSPSNADFRMKRAECHIQIGDSENAIGDLLRATLLKSDNTEALLLLANIHGSLGELDKSIEKLKECLRFDPDHKKCKPLYRKIKKVQKSMEKLDNAFAANQWTNCLKFIYKEPNLYDAVQQFKSKQLTRKLLFISCKAGFESKDNALDYCTRAIESDDQNSELFVIRGQVLMDMDEFDRALKDLSRAHELNPNNQMINQLYRKAQRLQKQASRKDYYKVLGVSRSSSDREIKKAYRKLAQEWHPDKAKNKSEAEKRMSEINEAYTVLSDKESREKYDNGQDPNDPYGGHSGFGHEDVFQQFFGGGGPFGGNTQFQFRFQ